MSVPEKPASAGDTSQAEWEAFYRQAFAASSKVLAYIERDLAVETGINPQQAGLVLLLCMGRLQGRYGFRHLGASASWEAWVNAGLRPLFEQAFRGERAQED